MRFVSTFAGVGGFDIALERAGHECVGQVEIDKFATQVLAEHWPDVPRHDDIRTAKEWADAQRITGAVELVVGGFPCQDLSVAGRRTGFDGERSVLAFDFIDFAKHVGARHVLLENVPGLLTSHGGRDFAVLIDALALAGYAHIEWRVLDSQHFGIPQRRRRIFVVATAADLGGRSVLTESEDLRWHPDSFRASGPEVAGASALGAGSEGATWIVKSKRARSADDDESWLPNAVVPTLNVFDNGDSRATTVVGSWWDNSQVSPTIDVSLASKGQTMPDKGRLFAVLDPAPELSVRRLTPVECERLQGFPDDWTAACSMSQRYKQMGNAVTVNVIDYIAALMKEAGLE